MVRSLWKGPFIESGILKQIYLEKKKTDSYNYQFFKICSRNSVIFPSFVGLIFDVYNGKKFVSITIKKNMVGLKFGEFVLTRKLTKHKKV